MRAAVKTLHFVFLLTLCQPLPLAAQDQEYTVKAIFLEKFLDYIDWPEESGIADTSSPFVLAVIGDNPFGTLLDDLFAGQKIKNKKAEIRYLKTPEQINDCHLLFISRSMKNKLSSIMSQVKGKPILTVGDTPGFAESGVHINFKIDGRKTRFELNAEAVKRTDFTIKYNLIRAATLVSYNGMEE